MKLDNTNIEKPNTIVIEVLNILSYSAMTSIKSFTIVVYFFEFFLLNL